MLSPSASPMWLHVLQVLTITVFVWYCKFYTFTQRQTRLNVLRDRMNTCAFVLHSRPLCDTNTKPFVCFWYEPLTYPSTFSVPTTPYWLSLPTDPGHLLHFPPNPAKNLCKLLLSLFPARLLAMKSFHRRKSTCSVLGGQGSTLEPECHGTLLKKYNGDFIFCSSWLQWYLRQVLSWWRIQRG